MSNAAVFSSAKGCNRQNELEKHCRQRMRKEVSRRARALLKQTTSVDLGIAVDHHEEQVRSVEEERKASLLGSPKVTIQKLEICEFCIFTKTKHCKCKVELEKQSNQKKMVSGDNGSRTNLEDKPNKMPPVGIKINLNKKQALFTTKDTEESSTMVNHSKTVGSSWHQENRSDCEKPGEIESLEEETFKPPLNENRGGIWVAFDKSLLDTLNAGLCFFLTNDGQVMLYDQSHVYLERNFIICFQVDILCKSPSDSNNVSIYPKRFRIKTNQAIFVPFEY